MRRHASLLQALLPSVVGVHLHAPLSGASAAAMARALQTSPQNLASFSADFPHLMGHVEGLAAAVAAARDSAAVPTSVRGLLERAYDEPTSARKYRAYELIRNITPSYLSHGRTYTEAELSDAMDEEFLHGQLVRWAATPSNRPPLPRGLQSRSETFKASFRRNLRRCPVLKSLGGLLRLHAAPAYGKHCGVNSSREKSCRGPGARMGRNDTGRRCGFEVCNDHGLDELCCEHDRSVFFAEVVHGSAFGRMSANVCEVDKRFWDGLTGLQDSSAALDFDDGGGSTFGSVEREALEGAICFLFAAPCLELTSRPHVNGNRPYWRLRFHFGQYPPDDCDQKQCYSWRPREERIVHPYGGLLGTLVP